MNSADMILRKLRSFNKLEMLNYLFQERYLKREIACVNCQVFLKFVPYARHKDGYAFRCMNKSCNIYKKYFCVRAGSFFDQFTVDFLFIIEVILKLLSGEQLHTILKYYRAKRNTIKRIITALNMKIKNPDFSEDKLDGAGFIVQIDKTMLYYKCKSHRGRSPDNKTDALCIVETSDIIDRVLPVRYPIKKRIL